MEIEALYTYLEIIGIIVGLVYLWLEYRASIHLWAVGIVMPAIYIFIYYRAGLYADFAFNIYYLLAAVYGWIMWKRSERQRQLYADEQLRNNCVAVSDSGIRSIFAESSGLIAALSFVGIALFFLIAMILLYLTDSQVPWSNAFNASLSIVAMWMLAKKYVEQWWVWVVADIASAVLYIHTELYYTAALYTLYAVIAVFGYFKWRKMMNLVTLTQA